MQQPAALPYQRLEHALAVDSVEDRLAHAQVAQRRRGRRLAAVEVEESDAVALTGDHLEVGHAAHLLGLLVGDVPREIEAAGKHLGELGLRVGMKRSSSLSIFDGGLGLSAK